MPKKVSRTSHRPGGRRAQRPRPRPAAPTAVLEPPEDLEAARAEAGAPARTTTATAPARPARLPATPRTAGRPAFTPDDYRYLRRDLRQVVILAGAIILAMLVLWVLRQAGVVTLV
jgi:hypothetical protein